jgi:CHAT domain-containing protein/Tfp pilus assembly protein PilF
MNRGRWPLKRLAGWAAALGALGLLVVAGLVGLGRGHGPSGSGARPPAAERRGPTADAAPDEPPRDLLAAPADERPVAAGARHVYAVDLAAGHVVRVSAEQRGADVALAVVDPEGVERIVVDRPIGDRGAERVSLLAARAGVHRLEVRNPGPAGRYILRIVDGPRPATAADRRRAEAERLFMAGRAHEKQGGREAFRAAAETYRRVHDLAAEAADPQLQAISLARLADCLLQLDDVERAYATYGRALPMLAAAGETSREAEVHNSLGVIDRGGGRFDEALAHYAAADRLGAAAGNEPARAMALGNRGVVRVYQGRFQEALDAFREQRDRWRRLGWPRDEVDTLNRLGELYVEAGESRLALDVLAEALAIARREGYEVGVANAFERQARAHLQRGELTAAQDLLERARSRIGGLDRPYALAGILNNLGRVLRLRGRYPEALAAFDQALAIYRARDARRDVPVVLMHLGWTREGMGEPAAALPLYDQARAGYAAAGNLAGVASTRYGAARAELALDRLPAALRSVEAALGWVEEQHQSLADPSLASSYLASKQDYFALKIEILMRLHDREPGAGHAARALAVTDAARARALVESLRAARDGLRAGGDPALLARRQALGSRIRGLEIAARDPELRERPASDGGDGLGVRLEDLLAEDRFIEARLRAADPRYAALTRPRPPSLDEVQDRLLDDGVLLLVYALGEQRSYLWAVDRRRMTVHALPARATLEREARRAYDLLVRSRELRAEGPLREALRSLGERLLGPVAARLADRRLVVVADGALHYVPFAALPAPAGAGGEGDPLVVRHEVVSLPSLSVLAELRRTLAARRSPELEIAVLADPVFQPDDARWPADRPRPPRPAAPAAELAELAELAADLGVASFERLEYAGEEAEAILALAPEAASLRALDFDASLATVTAASLRRYRYLHIASHSVIDEKRPELSGLVFSLFDSRGRPIPGILRLRDLYDLELPVDLVVLSACRTALGEEVRGEGLVGLTRGFMYAGAPRVVVSLWNVNDRATAALMERFYHGLLREGLPPAAALRAAQEALRRERGWEAPFYWAGFVLQGEWR